MTEVTVEEAAVPVPGMAGMAGYEQAAAYPGPQVRTGLAISGFQLFIFKTFAQKDTKANQKRVKYENNSKN